LAAPIASTGIPVYAADMGAQPAVRSISLPVDPSQIDQRVILHGVPWEQYEALLVTRGESASIRLTYLRGSLELMTPSIEHEGQKTLLGRLLEAFAEENAIDLNGFGSWTIRSAPMERGLEPDECYVVGDRPPEVPDLALEVIWTHGGIDKLEVYRGLGVPEVWIWRNGTLEIHVLRGEHYERSAASELFPALDLALLTRFLGQTNQTRAVREYRATLRAAAR
jgi:Uma2 family endonuclease